MPWRNNWEEIREIDRGGQGIVTELQSKSDPSKKAVLKQIVPRWRENAQAIDRLQQEIETLQKLNNLNARVPMVYESSIDYPNSEPFVIMEFVKGIRFDEWLRNNAPVKPKEGAEITLAIAETIRLCHQNNIGHRDLKPANVILKDGSVSQPYILDFGISFDSRQTVALTREGEMFWNEFLILPECQDLGGGHRDLRSDVTALVGIFFSCVTAQMPGVLRDAKGIAPHRRIVGEKFKKAESPEQAERLIWLFDKGFEYRIEDRFKDLDDFVNELNGVVSRDENEYFDLGEQCKLLDQAVMAKDRKIQLIALEEKYYKIYQGIREKILSFQSDIRKSNFSLSTGGLNTADLKKINKLPGVGDVLGRDMIPFYKVNRDNYEPSAIVLLAACALGMQIHLYTTSYFSMDSNVMNMEGSLLWEKVIIIDDGVSSLTSEGFEMIISDIRRKLAYQVGRLARQSVV